MTVGVVKNQQANQLRRLNVLSQLQVAHIRFRQKKANKLLAVGIIVGVVLTVAAVGVVLSMTIVGNPGKRTTKTCLF